MQTFDYLIHYPVFRYAVATGLIVALVCSLLSVVVVLKRMAFIGQGISHAGFGGIGVAFIAGLIGTRAQDAVVLGFCVLAAVGIGVLTRRRQLQADTAIGIMLAGTMALGAVLVDATAVLREQAWYRSLVGEPPPPPNYEQILFGSLTAVGPAEMLTAAVLGTLVVLTLALLAKEILYFSFDETAAHVSGVRTGLLYYLVLVLLSLAIVVSIRLVGIILVAALLVIPGATAVLLSRRLGVVIAAAAGVGVLGTAGGIVASLELGDISPGACIVMVLAGVFGAVFIARALLARRRTIAAG